MGYAGSCRAVVTDLDGTIVGDDDTVTAATLDAAAALAALRIPLVLATARTPAGVLALGALIRHVDIAVCCGGALAWLPTDGRPLWQDRIEAMTAKTIVHGVTVALPGAGVAAYDGQRWMMTATYAAQRHGRVHGPWDVVAAGQIDLRRACMLSVCHAGYGAAELAELLVRDVGISRAQVTMTWPDTALLDIAPPNVDKCMGVRRALTWLDVAPSDAVAFGDMPNDLPMFQLCGHAVAVSNAHPDVRAAADLITGSVDADGFARALYDLGILDRRRLSRGASDLAPRREQAAG